MLVVSNKAKMIVTLLIITAMFAWLGYETDWLTARLLVGIDKPPIIPCTPSQIRLLRNKYFNNSLNRSMKAWGSYIAQAIAEPLCGWDYIRDCGGLQQEYKMEVVAYGVTNRITLKNPSTVLLKDIARSMLHKPTLRRLR